jgi:Leucine Rich repeat
VRRLILNGDNQDDATAYIDYAPKPLALIGSTRIAYGNSAVSWMIRNNISVAHLVCHLNHNCTAITTDSGSARLRGRMMTKPMSSLQSLHVEISTYSTANHRSLLALIKYAPSLQSLSLVHSNDVASMLTDSSLLLLMRQWPILKHLYLHLEGTYDDSLSDMSLTALPECCPLLESLCLSNMRLASTNTIAAIARACHRTLRRLELFCMTYHDAVTLIISKTTNVLEQLSMTDDGQLSHAAILGAVQHCSRLVSLSIWGPPTSSPYQIHAFILANISIVTDALIQDLVMVCPCMSTTLEMLSLEGCYRITNEGIDWLNACTLLRKLNISGLFQVTGSQIKHLVKHLVHLQELDISHCQHISDAVLDSISVYCPRLERLVLFDCPRVTDVAVIHLWRACKALKTVDIKGRTRVNDVMLTT